MKWLKRQEGQAFPLAMLALVVGMIMVTPFLGLVSTSMLGSGTYGHLVRQNYSADAGVEYAIWHLRQGSTDVPSFTLNGDTVNVAVADMGDGVYDIVSVASGGEGTTTIEARVGSEGGAGNGVFSYAVVTIAGPVQLAGDARIYSDDYPALNAPVFAHGNVVLNNNTRVDGDVFATGSITVAPGAAINGTSFPGQSPLANLSDQVSQLNAMVSGWQAQTMAHGCATINWGPQTDGRNNYSPPAGTYPNPVNARQNMTISSPGTWLFQSSVCAGDLHPQKGDLTIGGAATVTIQGPVKSGLDLIITGWGTTVVIEGTLCVDRNLIISQGSTVVVHGPVNVGGNITTSEWSGSVTFHDTVYAGGNVSFTHGKHIYLGGKMYSGGRLTVDNAVNVTGGQYIIAAGNILVQGGAMLNNDVVSAAAVPFLVSTGGSVTLAGGSRSTALVYAPSGEVQLGGYSSASLVGAVFAQSFRTTNWGGKTILYPVGLGSRSDLPGGSGGGGEGITILSWNITTQ